MRRRAWASDQGQERRLRLRAPCSQREEVRVDVTRVVGRAVDATKVVRVILEVPSQAGRRRVEDAGERVRSERGG